MIISSITLHNFRIFRSQTFLFHPQKTIIIGENTRGKTSILEAVYCLIRGSGFRESREEELIHWDDEATLLYGLFSYDNDEHLFQVHIKKVNDFVEKSFYVNKTKKTYRLYSQQHTKTVLFAPEHIFIISGSPAGRRKYIDEVICSYNYEYKKHLRNYEHGLRKRNKILEHTQDQGLLDEELLFWDEYLAEQASYLTNERKKYIQYLNDNPSIDDVSCYVKYHANMFTLDRLKDTQKKERLLRKTLIGPQKDDIELILKNRGLEKNVHLYGSRSEQRLALFWLKLNEIRLMEDSSRGKPILLLDDIFSELDGKNKDRVMKLIDEYQTILSTTERDLLQMGKGEKGVIEL